MAAPWSRPAAAQIGPVGGRPGPVDPAPRGVIIGPIRIRVVRAAITAKTVHGSTIGGLSPSFANARWSHRKNPSKPACSAATPSSTSSAGSSAKQGAATPRCRALAHDAVLSSWLSSPVSSTP